MSEPIWTAPPGTAALIFDCDGTLADTMPGHYVAWCAMLGRLGIAFPEPRFYAMGGMPTGTIIRVLAAEAGVPVGDVDALVHEKEQLFLGNLAAVTRIEPVVRVAEWHRGKLPIAVASGGYRDTISRTLAQLELSDWFDATVTAEDTTKHKPEPDVFLEAARRLGASDPARCVVFEDTDIGLEAARRAGMFGIDVRPWVASARAAR